MSSQSKSTKKTQTKKQASKDQSNMKYEIASEFGVKLGAEATSRQNGSVGGEMTRRLVKMAKDNMQKQNSESK